MDNSHRGDGITAEFLRSGIDGKFKMGDHHLLPHKENGNNYAGDFRAPEMPGLQSMHILFVREHNRIADLVKEALQNSGHGEYIKAFGALAYYKKSTEKQGFFPRFTLFKY